MSTKAKVHYLKSEPFELPEIACGKRSEYYSTYPSEVDCESCKDVIRAENMFWGGIAEGQVQGSYSKAHYEQLLATHR